MKTTNLNERESLNERKESGRRISTEHKTQSLFTLYPRSFGSFDGLFCSLQSESHDTVCMQQIVLREKEEE